MSAVQIFGAVGVMAFILAIGFLSGRHVKSAAAFEAGSGSSGCGAVAGALLSSVVGGSCTIGTAQLAYHSGLSAWWFTLSCALGCLVSGLLFVGPFRRSKSPTLMGITRQEYGEKVDVAASLLICLATLSTLIAQLISASAVVPFIFPGISVPVSVALSAVLMLGYVIFGGTLGAGEMGKVKTLFLYIAVLAGVLIVLRTAGLRTLWQQLDHDVYFDLFARGVSAEASKALSVTLGIVTGPSYMLAIRMARSDRAARSGEFITALLIPPIGFGGVLIGMFMQMSHPDLASAKDAFPQFILSYMPDLMGGIVMGTLLLTIISSGASMALGAAVSVNRDILQPCFHTSQDPKRSLRNTRLCLVVMFAVASCLSTGALGDVILNFGSTATALRSVILFAPLCCALFLPGRIPSRWALAAVLIGPAAALLFTLWPVLPLNSLASGLLVSCLLCAVGALRGRKPSLP